MSFDTTIDIFFLMILFVVLWRFRRKLFSPSVVPAPPDPITGWFGGTSSSFPALKRTSLENSVYREATASFPAIKIHSSYVTPRLADDSAVYVQNDSFRIAMKAIIDAYALETGISLRGTDKICFRTDRGDLSTALDTRCYLVGDFTDVAV